MLEYMYIHIFTATRESPLFLLRRLRDFRRVISRVLLTRSRETGKKRWHDPPIGYNKRIINLSRVSATITGEFLPEAFPRG